jgi:hypothetical protein
MPVKNPNFNLPGSDRKAAIAAAVASRPPETCAHHWLIETPNGALSAACCKRCGAEREMPNSIESLLYGDFDMQRGRGE